MITQDDLRREREATAAKLKAFLEGDDDTDSYSPTTIKSRGACSTGTLKPPSLGTTSVTAGITSSSGGLALAAAQLSSTVESSLAKPHVTKSVSFAPLPSQLTISTCTTTSSLLPYTTSTTSSGHVEKDDSSIHRPLTSDSTFQQASATSTVVSLPTTSISGQNSFNPLASQSGIGLSVSASGVFGNVSTPLKSTVAVQSGLILPSLAVTSKPAEQNGQPANKSLQGSQTCLQSSQPQATSQPSMFQSSLGSAQLSLSQATQASIQPSLFNQAPAATTQSSLAKPSLVPTSQTNAQASLFPSSQSGIQQASLFQSLRSSTQTSVSLPSLTTSHAGIQSSMFQASQASAQPSLFQASLGKSSVFGPASVASTQPSILQTSQAGMQSFTFQASQASAQPSIFQASLATSLPTSQHNSQPSLFQTTQSGTQSSLFQGALAKPLLPQVGAQVSLFQTSQANAQPALFQTPQAGIRSSLFQTSMATPLQVSQANSQPSLFQTSQPGIQSSLFQTPSAKPTLQALQTNAQPSLFQVSQASSQPSLFKLSTQTTTQPFANTPTTQAQTSSLFTKNVGPSNTPTFFFGQNSQQSNAGGTPSQQQSTSGLFSNIPSANLNAQSKPSSFNFSATKQPQLQPPASSNTGFSFGAPQVKSVGTPFNFMQQNTVASLGSGQQNAAPGMIQFGGGLNQQQVGGGVGFQTPQGGNIFNFSKSTGPSTPSGSGRAKNKARGKRKY